MDKTLINDTFISSEIEIVPFKDVDDGKNHKTHIINPSLNTHIWMPNMTSKDIVDIARLTGQSITALCGYTWIPKRNPEKYDICKECMNIAVKLINSINE